MSLKDMRAADIKQALFDYEYTVKWFPNNWDEEAKMYVRSTVEKSYTAKAGYPEGLEDILYTTQNGAPAIEMPGLGSVRMAAQHGGEGQGDEYYYVVEITDGEVTRYFRFDGYYSSYNGTEFDGDMDEVMPAQRNVTVWE